MNWQEGVISEYCTAIEAAADIDALEKVAVDVYLSSQRWLKDACIPIIKKRHADLNVDPKAKLMIIDSMYWIRMFFSQNGDKDECTRNFMRRLGYAFSHYGTPRWIVCVADTSETEMRKAMCPEYKSSRDDRPTAINAIAKNLKEECERLQIPWLTESYYEADDIAATLCTRATARGVKCVICTSDKDYYQLVSRDVIIHDGKGWVNVDAVFEKLGVTVEQVIDYLCMIGKDDLRSPHNIGPKTAAELLKEHGDFTGIYDHRHKLTESRRTAIETFAKDYYLVRECHKLNRNINVDFDWKRTHCLA